MKLKFWGCRGSIVSPGIETKYYGGSTSCVEVITDDGFRLILDAGTGIIPLSKKLASSVSIHTVVDYKILLTHTHNDHVQGFVFFEPIHHINSYITIFCPKGTIKSLSTIIGNLFQAQYSPLKSIDNLKAQIDFVELEETAFNVGPFNIIPIPLDHNILTYGYRIRYNDIDIVYATDHEARPNEINQRLIEKAKGTQILIHDSQYTDEEYRSKTNWGHSSLSRVAQNALEINPQLLILFHHNPNHNDKQVESKMDIVNRMVKHRFRVISAKEGLTLKLRVKEDLDKI